MTNEEAIKYIKANYPDSQAYERLCEALDLAIKAMERGTPKECKMFRSICECQHNVFPHMKYCDNCGKKLEWSK